MVTTDDQLQMLDHLARLAAVVQHLARKSPHFLEAVEISVELDAMNKRLQPGPVDELLKLVAEPNVTPLPRRDRP
jgi:hypothetical protein